MLERWLRLGLAISVWSLSALLIYESRGLASPAILALYAVTLGSLVTCVALVVSGQLRVGALLGAGKGVRWTGEAMLLGLAAFVVYPLLYFSAIQNGPPAAVNLVNYVWPVVAVVLVAIWRPAERSLETGLAAGFGFAGAGLAIAAGSTISSPLKDVGIYPFLLAALGALVYGAASGGIRLRHPTEEKDDLLFFAGALLVGGTVAALVLVGLSLFEPQLVVLRVSGNHLWALLVYALLLPVGHLSWMIAAGDRRLPAFPTAFLVPVISTGLLTLVVSGVANPEILSALVLVLCGVTFASAAERGVPVGYAVTLAVLSSIQISQLLAGQISAEIDVQTDVISQLLVAIVAIFAGFVLASAIERNGALHSACSRFYAKAWSLMDTAEPGEIRLELDRLDATVIHGSDKPDEFAIQRGPVAQSYFATEWADVEVAVSNRVSAYEWVVLLVGAGSLILALQAYAVQSTSTVTVILRALGVSLVVGILFAIRDYDRHRPQHLCDLLTLFRKRYGIAVDPGSPLAAGQAIWTRNVPFPVRLALAALILVAIVAITLNA